ncbi:MAG: DUF4130 domain-containing protein [Promethearchaeia archaeon]
MKKSGDPLKVLGRGKGYSRDKLIKNITRHEKFTPDLIHHIKKLPDVVLRNLGTPMAKNLIKMVREIFRESYRAKQFTRTNINDRGVLYGIVLLKHRVMDLVLNYFHERWPKCIICLYNEHTQKTGIMDQQGKIKEVKMSLKEVVDKISKHRPVMPYFEDIQFTGKEIFETLYETQNITERNNKRYFKQMIPDKCYELPGLRNGIEKRFDDQNKKLDDFL